MPSCRPDPIDLVYTLNVNEYKGDRTLQLMYVDSRPSPAQRRRHCRSATECTASGRSAQGRCGGIEIYAAGTKHRRVVYRRRAARELTRRGHLRPPLAATPRTVQMNCTTGSVVLWSIPPSPELLRWLLNAVKPKEVYLCGQYTADDMLSVCAAFRRRHVQICAQPPTSGDTASCQSTIAADSASASSRSSAANFAVGH